MGVGRDRYSTKAIREGYKVLGFLMYSLTNLLCKKEFRWWTPSHKDESEWRYYIVQHTTEFKRGGPEKSIGKRRKAKKKDRQVTTR